MDPCNARGARRSDADAATGISWRTQAAFYTGMMALARSTDDPKYADAMRAMGEKTRRMGINSEPDVGAAHPDAARA